MTGAKDNNEDTPSLGSWLKSAREQRGESLEKVSAITRIGKGYLQALEEDQLEKLPSPAYTKGFIRLYANHLGLPGDEAVQRMDRSYRQEAEYPESGSIGKAMESKAMESEAVKSATFSRLRKWSVPLLLLLIVAVFTVLQQSKNRAPGQVPSSPPPPSLPLELPAATAPTVQAPQNTIPTDSPAENPASKAAQPAASGIILRLKAVQDGKIHITIDGAISQEYDLKNGDIIEWKAETMFLLELDNAGSVEGELNGTRMKAFGEPDKAVHLTIKADTILH